VLNLWINADLFVFCPSGELVCAKSVCYLQRHSGGLVCAKSVGFGVCLFSGQDRYHSGSLSEENNGLGNGSRLFLISVLCLIAIRLGDRYIGCQCLPVKD